MARQPFICISNLSTSPSVRIRKDFPSAFAFPPRTDARTNFRDKNIPLRDDGIYKSPTS